MAEAAKYVVVCSCGGQIKPIAYLDDGRALGGALRVDAPAGQMIVIAPELASGPEPRDSPDDHAAMFTEHNVTRVHWNRWSEDRITWVIRCGECSAFQVQMSQATYELVADRLAAEVDKLPKVAVPQAHNLSAVEQRHLIQIGVLNFMVTQANG